ncbi:MAG: hypothetical protein IKU30_03065 [Clostridia bacterium]|nr:hypothetical protein [Clostridia bacterium]
MKKLTVLILIFSLALACLASCAETENESSVDIPDESSVVTESESSTVTESEAVAESSLTVEESSEEENSEQSEESIEIPEIIPDFTVSKAPVVSTDESRVYEKAVSDGNKLPVVYKFDTREELDSFKSEYEDLFHFKNPSSCGFNEATVKYDDAFFENNTLIVIYLESPCYGDEYIVGEIYNDLSTVRIQLVLTDVGWDQGSGGKFITVAMPDAMMKNVNTYIVEMAFAEHLPQPN